mmetsp:Transcript_25683/g.59919  ORF Transcript_25683/g.59919 Transcript_25683/m.59919 type:complete len:225 (-) Transcript_25683:69-743(-)
MAVITCSIGVMPVPPAIIPSLEHTSSLLPILNLPWPRYWLTPHGPEMSIESPTLSASMYCDILPPSGKFGLTPPLYTLMTRSTKPTSSSELVGVYLRSISCSSASGSSRPFHFPATDAFGFGANSLKCLATGKPRTGVSFGRTKRKRTVSCEIWKRAPSFTLCRCLLRNLAFGVFFPERRMAHLLEMKTRVSRAMRAAATRGSVGIPPGAISSGGTALTLPMSC